ncbi:hypothetical protein LE190_16050 [Massilia oculi]|uniref:Uncharacterized protein n=1 Tax=Massilia hydrophila TaxID=3044279 RepID=A0ABS7YCJ1_9BURK|nr:hypothetical protein [Massilia oculi]MCA1857426.1 hypothetical protein [Massilia oculi]
MKYAVATWIAPLIIVEVDPSDFDGPHAVELEKALADHFRGASFALITPDIEPDSGIRARGLSVPHDVLTDQRLVWHDLVLPGEPELPF